MKHAECSTEMNMKGRYKNRCYGLNCLKNSYFEVLSSNISECVLVSMPCASEKMVGKLSFWKWPQGCHWRGCSLGMIIVSTVDLEPNSRSWNYRDIVQRSSRWQNCKGFLWRLPYAHAVPIFIIITYHRECLNGLLVCAV